MSHKIAFTKENLDFYLLNLSKEYKKLGGRKMPAEIILIGGASILINYGFRESTYDMDAIIHASSSMKEAINHIADRYELPSDWLNADFRQTDSYSSKLVQVSKYYRTFSNVLSVRTVASEYLVAMKLRSARRYKNDISDILGIIIEEKKHGNILTEKEIETAVIELYGSIDILEDYAKLLLHQIFKTPNLETLYEEVRQEEIRNRSTLIDFEKKYPKVLTKDNLNKILEDSLKKGNSATKTDKSSVI